MFSSRGFRKAKIFAGETYQRSFGKVAVFLERGVFNIVYQKSNLLFATL